MAAKTSALGKLHERFTQLLIQELNMYMGLSEDGTTDPDATVIPMSAADKAVYIAFFKQNGITAEPDSDAMANLRDAFSKDVETRRAARAALLVSEVTAEAEDPSHDLSQFVN
jgi:hypothetical protein